MCTMSESEAPPAKQQSEAPIADVADTKGAEEAGALPPETAPPETPPPETAPPETPPRPVARKLRRQRPILHSDALHPPFPSAKGTPRNVPSSGGASASRAGPATAEASPSDRAPASNKVIKASKRWLPIILTGLLLAAGGLAAVFGLLVRPAGGPELTSKVPRDLDIYVEVPSLERLVEGLSTMRFLDEKKLDIGRWIGDAQTELANTLDVSDKEAKQILEGVDTIGVAARVGQRDYDGVLLVRFASSKPARVLLRSERFFEADDEGAGGKRYLIDRQEPEEDDESADSKPYDPTLSPSLLKRKIFGVSLRGNEQLAWFKNERLMVLGHPGLIDDIASVLKGKHKSLDDNERFVAARQELPRSVAAFGFVDSQVFEQVLGRRDREVLDFFLKKPEPIIASLSFADAGSRFSVSGGLSGKMIPPDAIYTEPAAMTLHKRLPQEVMGYLALSTKMDMSGGELEALVLDTIDDADRATGKQIRRHISGAERDLGFRLTSLYDALGDEAVVALMPHKSYQLDITKEPNIAQDFAVAYVQHTSDVEVAKRIVRKIRSSVFPKTGAGKQPFRVRKDDSGGFTAEPDDPTNDPFVMVRFADSHVMVAVGRRAVCERFWAAFTEGKDTLGGDDSHDAAIDALPSNGHGYAWVDTGRVFAEVLQANPGLEKSANQYGFDPSTVATTGNERLTSAAGIMWSVKEKVWKLKLSTLNTTWPLPIAAYVDHMRTEMRTRTYGARNTIKAIAAAANAVYRSNRYDWRNYTDTSPNALDRLCEAAVPVPASIPRHTAHVPSAEPGEDWNTGADKVGWKCLKFSLVHDMYYQYTYNVGGRYKGPGRGGPDPGPNGFEIAAEGDLDGDGKTSLFTMTGIIDPTTGTLTLASTEFAVDELE